MRDSYNFKGIEDSPKSGIILTQPPYRPKQILSLVISQEPLIGSEEDDLKMLKVEYLSNHLDPYHRHSKREV
jgi:hypothetical protein